MQIYSIQSFAGKNIFSHKPVIKMVLDIGEMADKTSADIEGFNEKLIRMFPGISKHRCSLGYEGGFVERLKEGTYLGHVTEHLILELQHSAGYDVVYGKTRLVSEPSIYYVVFEYMNERCAIECARSAVSIIDSIARGQEIDLEKIMHNIRRTAAESELGPTTKAIYNEAQKRGIPVMRVGNDSILQLGCGKYTKLIQASLTDKPNCISVDMAGNKHLTKQLLSEHGIPVPYGDIVYTEESAVIAASNLGYPVVVKPCDGNQGKGVILDLKSENEVRIAYREASRYSRSVIVERFISGHDYRLLVINGKLSAAAERHPPSVTGDGIHSIRELAEIENTNSARGEDHEKPLTLIKLDSVVLEFLRRNNIDENYIPRAGEKVVLRENANLSTGGTARDCTDEVHPQNAALAVRAASILGLDVAGIDITAGDISKPIEDGTGAILEVNAAPGLRMHLYPSEGQKRNVAGDILDMLYPPGSKYDIPIVSITGTNGKTTTTRLVRHTLGLAGKKVGMTSTSGVFIGETCVLKGDNTGPSSARMVLSNKEVEVAVLETARGGIVRRGLGYDAADVGVVVNISEDHLGLDNVHNINDLAFVKSLVVEALKPEGYAVLNADDGMTPYMLERIKNNVMLFASKRGGDLIEEQINRGGRAAYSAMGSLYIFDGQKHFHVIKLKNIPITMNGAIECNIENSLAALSALYCLDTPIDIIRKGLSTFMPDIKTNPGRFNIFDMGSFRVMLDYGHNPAGYNAVIKFMQKSKGSRCVGIVGMPGDRPDASIYEVGGMCGSFFSKLYIKEDADLRGRKPGEVAQIFYKAAIAGGLGQESVEIVLSEIEALEKAMREAQPGDMIVMFYENFEAALESIQRFRIETSFSITEENVAVG